MSENHIILDIHDIPVRFDTQLTQLWSKATSCPKMIAWATPRTWDVGNTRGCRTGYH